MARLVSRQKLSLKSNIKPMPTVKQPKKESGVEFRWSTSINQLGTSANDFLVDFQLIDLDNSQQKVVFTSTSSPIRDSSVGKSPSPSLRLPDIHDGSKRRKSVSSTDENLYRKSSPISLSYSQLHHAQIPSQAKKNTRVPCSFLSLLNDKRSSNSTINNNTSSSSNLTNQQQLINEKYIRLQTSQLRRLQVSNKYLKEAKKLYFNAASKVFVPRHSIVEIS